MKKKAIRITVWIIKQYDTVLIPKTGKVRTYKRLYTARYTYSRCIIHFNKNCGDKSEHKITRQLLKTAEMKDPIKISKKIIESYK